MEKVTFTQEQIVKFAEFVRDYHDHNLNDVVMFEIYGIDVEHLNAYEAIDTYLNQHEFNEAKRLWGDELLKVFERHLNAAGWLTSDWATIIENEIPRFDKDYKDNPLYKDTYSRMYNLDFKESEDGLFIRPVENLN